MRDWMQELRELPKEQLRIEHNPPTERYGRAFDKRKYIINSGQVLGTRTCNTENNPVEIAVWVGSPFGKGFGYYVCFRIWSYEGKAVLAVLFCFYDGTEGSKGLKSLNSAKVFANEKGFEEDDL